MHENLFELVDRPLRSPSKLIGAIDMKAFSTTRLELWIIVLQATKRVLPLFEKFAAKKGHEVLIMNAKYELMRVDNMIVTTIIKDELIINFRDWP